VLQWAQANGWPWGPRACQLAAEGGYLEWIQWARENGCPWAAWTCHFAAKGGHLSGVNILLQPYRLS
jgi:hypothetical protein